jgi:glycolate oxidase iron-sulfur subunit
MQTRFAPEALLDPDTASSEAVIRKCVHCGFCTATCPTYVLLGDELDSPRGRIYLIKEMLEAQAAPTPAVVKHVDRCLSCLSCMTTCPSGVNYMHLVDHARAYIEERYKRPFWERVLRALLALVLPYPRRFRAALILARMARPAGPWLGKAGPLAPFAAMLALAPSKLPKSAAQNILPGAGAKGRVALLAGCAEPVLRPQFQDAAVRLLNRIGYKVVRPARAGCCGALVHHMGKNNEALEAARRNVDAWTAEIEGDGLTAILVTASGCGTTVKDYGYMLRNDPAYARKAERVSALAKDISEFLVSAGLPSGEGRGVRVAYQAACSLQHGQKVTDAPKRLLEAAGYEVETPNEAHLCCGSAGTYNILQPKIARQLGLRKAGNLARLAPDVIATGNVGCAVQLEQSTSIPIVHTVELLDWATGGPAPGPLSHFEERIMK